MRASNRNRPDDPRAHDARTLAGVMAAALLLGGAASMVLGTAAEAQATAKKDSGALRATATAKPTPTPAKATATSATAAARTTVKPSTAPVKAVAAQMRPAPGAAAVKPVATTKNMTPATGGAATRTSTPAASSAIVQSSAHLDEQVTYQYNALGRRDPFQSLLSGEYVGSDVGGDAAPDVGGLKVVGIVWGDADQFALVEDARGDSHILRRGDKVMNGVVEALKRDAMIVNLTVDGQSQSVTIPLTRKGEKTNANR
jgi:hypothetical protein